MTDRFQDIMRALLTVLLLGIAGTAAGQPALNQLAPPASARSTVSPQAMPAPSVQAPATPADPRVNTAEITSRVNQELGVDLEATIAGWQRELDRLESDLRRPHQRYTELNNFRDEVQRIRSGIEDFWNRLQPRLVAAKAQVDLLGPAPAAGQPQEPEQVALSRAELKYQLGLLSGGQAAVNSARLRIDHLINTIQDIRRSNFTSYLFQPIPGVYSSETWAKLPEYVPLAVRRVGDLIADWWTNIRDHEEVARTGLEACLLWLLLTVVGWRGVRRLRLWRDVGEPPFWRRASSAAGVILLRALPVVAPTIFLYGSVVEAEHLPERVDWLFYSAAQSIIIVFTVNALITTVFAPRAPHWRLIPASDSAAARICGLVLVLAVVYGLTTFLYVVTRLVQAPFALRIAVALPSSLFLAGIVVAILLTPLEGKHKDGSRLPVWLKALRTPIWATIAAIVVCALAGYLALARFLAQQLIVTGSILALVYLLLLWVDGFAQGLGDDNTATGRWLKERAGLEQRRREQLALPIPQVRGAGAFRAAHYAAVELHLA